MSNVIYHIHHIKPKHMSGMDDPSNLIKLTISEHAAWHYELWVYYGKIEDYVAWQGLSGRIGKDEIFLLKCKLNGMRTMGTNNHFYGKHHSEESKEKNRLAHLGKKPSPESIAKRRFDHFLGKNHNIETKEKIRLKALGRKHSEETKQLMREKKLGRKRGPYRKKSNLVTEFYKA